MRHSRWSVLLCGAVLTLSCRAAAQERGTIAGRVLDEATGRPLASAQVTVAGTNLGTLTNQQGRYRIASVPAGVREVRVTRIGYASGARSVEVTGGEAARVDFRLAASAVAIAGIVATATGEVRRRREIGNALGSIEVAREVGLAPINTLADVLQGRGAGVTVTRSSGSTGTGARLRIRGSNSVSLSNEPLLIVDGIRVNGAAQSSSIHVGGQSPSRVEDLNPDEIESTEILKGPAAAAAYGTAAANGVVQITTRRGRAATTPTWRPPPSSSRRSSGATCRGLNDPQTPVADQARAVAARFHANFDTTLEDASFVKLRELALTLTPPQVLTRRLGRLAPREASLTLSGRNLRTWTRYRGLDPEISTSGQSTFGSVEYLSQPPVRYLTARLTLGL
jgi:TonB-dependent SusC/RagA subfamily outer membrane receptor